MITSAISTPLHNLVQSRLRWASVQMDKCNEHVQIFWKRLYRSDPLTAGRSSVAEVCIVTPCSWDVVNSVCILYMTVVPECGVDHLVHDFPHRNLRRDHRSVRHSVHQVLDQCQTGRRQDVYPWRLDARPSTSPTRCPISIAHFRALFGYYAWSRRKERNAPFLGRLLVHDETMTPSESFTLFGVNVLSSLKSLTLTLTGSVSDMYTNGANYIGPSPAVIFQTSGERYSTV